MSRPTGIKWKAVILDYAWIEQQTGSACYCLSAKSAQMLLTIASTLAWATRWEGNEFFTDEQRENIFQWANDCEAELMNGCCGDGGQDVRIRVNAEGRIEVSNDGGITFVVNNNYDPRSTGTMWQPVNTGDESEDNCQAAANATENLKDMVDEFVTILEAVTLAAGISASLAPVVAFWVGVPIGGAPVVAAGIIGGLVSAGAGFGAAAISSAFDTEFWDWFNCEYDCAIGNRDATWEDVDGLIEAINEEYTGGTGDDLTRRVVGFALLKALGPVGITNMARLGAAAADCSECDCDGVWCYTWDMTVTSGTAQGWDGSVETGYHSSWIDGVGWRGDEPGQLDRNFIKVSIPTTTITGVQVGITPFDGTAPMFIGSNCEEITGDLYSATGTPFQESFGFMSAGVEVDCILLGFERVGESLAPLADIISVTITGLGTNPFGESNC